MERQYIGARYVPKIYQNSVNPLSNEWEANTTYEALTIVSYNNSSYTSKKAVPSTVGNPVSNPSYWAETGAYNGQIANLQNQINSVGNRLSLLDNRRYVFIGDSYAQATVNWIDIVIADLGLTLGTNAFKISAASRGFIGDPNQSGDMSYLGLLQANIDNITDLNTITDIVVCGGINDAYASSYGADLMNAVTAFASYCKTHMPNAIVHCGLIGFSTDKDILANLEKVNYCYTQAISEYGTMIPNAHLLFHFSYWMSDSVHPNSVGMTAIGRGISSYLRTGNCVPQYTNGGNSAYTATFSGDFANVGNILSLNTRINGDTVYATFETDVPAQTPFQFTLNNQWHEIATLSQSFFVGGNHGKSFTSSGWIRLRDDTSGYQYYDCCAEFCIEGLKLYMKCPQCFGTSGNKTITLGAVNANFTVSAPALGN